jgi:hypothetical protein
MSVGGSTQQKILDAFVDYVIGKYSGSGSAGCLYFDSVNHAIDDKKQNENLIANNSERLSRRAGGIRALLELLSRTKDASLLFGAAPRTDRFGSFASATAWNWRSMSAISLPSASLVVRFRAHTAEGWFHPVRIWRAPPRPMSGNDLVDDLEEDAWAALLDTGAIRCCGHHRVTIRTGDSDAERRALTLASNALTGDGTVFSPEKLASCIKSVLKQSLDGECPECAKLQDGKAPRVRR